MKWVLVGILALMACETTKSTNLPLDLLNNRASLPFMVDGTTYVGVATLQRRPGNGADVKFILPKDTILFQLDNCARERVEIRPTGPTFTYTYRPSLFKEAEDSCIMQAQATTRKGELQTAIIDWTDSRSLPAKMWCNEELGVDRTGVAICQNRHKKLMWMEFQEEVVWAVSEGCPEPQQAKRHEKDKAFEILVGEGFCAYAFMSKGRERFRLTTFGYTTIREVNLEAEK